MSTPKPNDLMDISTRTILESISEGVITSDRRHRVVYLNRAAERILGVTREAAVGKRCSEVFHTSLCEEECVLLDTFNSNEPVTNRSAYLTTEAGDRIPVMISAVPLTDEDGVVVGGVETFRDVSLLENLRKELTGTVQLGDLVTRNLEMKRILDVLPQMAMSPSSVLIQGATGTGKEVLARAIHHLSLRHNRPFVAVNCGALPDTLLESELFGYEAGAFTGATKAKPGRFTLAEGGTLFLDEIGEISPAFQVKLLRVLQERTFEPLGSVKTLHSDVRIIAATNKNLMQEVRRGTFRDDLFYRLNVIQIDLPPLKKRKEDIPLLIDHFIRRFNAIQKKDVKGISTEALGVLMAYNFPGNIRELENFIERAFVLCNDGEIEMKHLPCGYLQLITIPVERKDLKTAMREMEKNLIEKALKRNKTKLEAADELGLHKSSLFRKMKELGIEL